MAQNQGIYRRPPDPARQPGPRPPPTPKKTACAPKTLDDYVGQDKVKGNLRIYLRAAQQRGEPMDHILLYGPARPWQNNAGRHRRAGDGRAGGASPPGPAIEKPGDLAALLTNLQEGDILFIDEIHRLSRQVEEVLYPALEDFALDIMIGKGPSAQSIRINLPRFTLIGATTRAGQLTGPLRDRFGILLKLEPYSPDELARINHAQRGEFSASPSTMMARWSSRAAAAARRAIANRLLKRGARFRDRAGRRRHRRRHRRRGAQADGHWTRRAWTSSTAACCARSSSCTAAARSALTRWPAALGEESVTLEDLCEPYLMQLGYLTRTPRGRCVTRLAYEHLRLPVPRRLREDDETDGGQQRLY